MRLTKPKQLGLSEFILGIDPGTHFMGLCLIEINTLDLSIKNIYSETLLIDKMIPEYIQNRFDKLLYIQSYLEYYLNACMPDYVIIETPYFHKISPSAYSALSELLIIIKLAIRSCSNNPLVKTYEPSIIKKAIGASAVDKKDKVLSKLFQITEVTTLIDLNLLDNNAIDAIAIAYTFLLSLRNLS